MNNYRQTIQRFFRSLNLALYDKQLELNGIPVHYYYDNDVLFKLVSGFDYCYPEIESSTPALSVRGLLAFGYLGEMNILRPHAFEFYEKIHHKTKNRSNNEDQQFIMRSKAYIQRSGIQNDMQTLKNILSKRSEDESDEVKDQNCKDFLSTLQEKPGETFSRIEQINGTWDQRLRRIYDSKLLNFNALGPDITELTDHNKDILNGIYRQLYQRRPVRYLNAFQDAFALAILNKFIYENELDDCKGVVRFYSETEPLEQVIKNSEIKELLTYQKLISGIIPPYDGDFIYRDADYFIVKAMFSVLLSNNQDNSLKHHIDITSLTLLSEKLNQYEKSLEDEKLFTAIESEEIDGKKLSELVQQFSDLKITQTLWHEGRIPEHLYKYAELKNWIEIFEFAQGERVGNILHLQIEDINEKLDSQVSRIKSWTDNFRAILNKLPKELIAKRNLPLEPSRDLGLVRWNYELSNDEADEILNSIEDLLSSDQTEIHIAVHNLADEIELSKKDPRKCMITCAVLWSFGCYEIIDKLVSDLIAVAKESIPISLSVMRLAARLKSGILLSDRERNSIADEVIKELDNLSDKRPILLGVGFVLFHLWKQIMIGKNALERKYENQSDQEKYLAEKSYECGEMAVKVFSESSLPWAYAINHCVYVGTMTNIHPNRTSDYFETLLRLKGFPAIWSPRFDDTLGCYYYLRAARKFFFAEDKSKINISADIEFAQQYFSEAHANDPGDIDIKEHIGLLDKLLNESGNNQVDFL